MAQDPFNPLDKKALADSISRAVLRGTSSPLPPPGHGRSGGLAQFPGAGIYAIYYRGAFEPYAALVRQRPESGELSPIYVGKAIPPGGRTGGMGSLEPTVDPVLWKRLKQHATSIHEATNLSIEDFECRFLRVDEIWIPLGENIFIEMFQPVWNTRLGGFGNHAPGSGRDKQKRSPWDTLHPGRSWAGRLPPNELDAAAVLRALEAGKPVLGDSVEATGDP